MDPPVLSLRKPHGGPDASAYSSPIAQELLDAIVAKLQVQQLACLVLAWVFYRDAGLTANPAGPV